jgi:hypothetical protein
MRARAERQKRNVKSGTSKAERQKQNGKSSSLRDEVLMRYSDECDCVLASTDPSSCLLGMTEKALGMTEKALWITEGGLGRTGCGVGRRRTAAC